METSHEEEFAPTILQVELFPTTAEKQNAEDFSRIRDLLSDHGFTIAEISTEQGGNPVLTDAFTTTAEHMDAVNTVQLTLDEWFPDHDVSYSQTYSDFYRETAVFPETHLISVVYAEGDVKER